MADKGYFKKLEHDLNYIFRRISLLDRALTAPGAEGDKMGTKEEQEKYDGNRKQAQLGISLLSLAVRQKVLIEEDASLSTANKILNSVTAIEHHEQIAKSLGVDTNIKLNPRQRGVVEPSTLSSALYAILGAVWQDCGQDQSVVQGVAERIFLDIQPSPLLDLQITSLKKPTESISFGDLIIMEKLSADSVFGNSSQVINSDVTMPHNTHESDDDQSPTILSNLQRSAAQELSQNQDNTTNDPTPATGLENWETEIFDDETTVFLPNHVQMEDLYVQQSADVVWMGEIDDPLEVVLVGRESPGPTRTSNIEEIQGSNSSSRPSTSNLGTSKKRKSPASHSESGSVQLDEYVMLERERCQSIGLTFSEPGFDLAITQASNMSKGNQFFTKLKTLYFAIGSPESLATLQEILVVRRRSFAGKQPRGDSDLSLVERIKIIEDTNPWISYHTFQRRCHIYQLLLDSRVGSYKTSDGFVNDTTQSVSTKTSPQIGNPINLEDSRISRKMMSELYPRLKPHTQEYTKKKRFVGSLRKLGERFDLLVEKFGYGIMGMLPLPGDDLAGEPALNVSDNFIFSIPYDIFKSLVLYLDQLQGEFLRETSKAVSKIVTALFQDQLDPSKTFVIEGLERSQIVQYPRGSQELRKLISSPLPPLPQSSRRERQAE